MCSSCVKTGFGISFSFFLGIFFNASILFAQTISDPPSCDCCTCTYCGDGIVISPEECDDGNTDETDFCRNCKLPVCADGINNAADIGEDCDGPLFNNFVRPNDLPIGTQIYCNADCNAEYCGDGIRNHPDETCDGNDFGTLPGVQVPPAGFSCTDRCLRIRCGDGLRNRPEETCDGSDFGVADGVQVAPAGSGIECDPLTCTRLRCGDGLRNRPEETCDGSDFGVADGVQVATAGSGIECDPLTCTRIRCGDGIVNRASEECDGNSFRAEYSSTYYTCNTQCLVEDRPCDYFEVNYLLQANNSNSPYDGFDLDSAVGNQNALSRLASCLEDRDTRLEISQDTFYLREFNTLNREFYLDKNCNIINGISGLRICGSLNFNSYSSPISLILDEKFGINEKWNVVKFQHDPRIKPSWSYWKASAKTPLLVYDPEHSGKITSGAQLFGNFTFGKRSGFLPISQDSKSVDSDFIWENGFEAMASLDVNKDGELTLTELEPISIWFDTNQNAVSEQGEVIKASEYGIHSLKTDYSHKDSRGDIYSKYGFTRKVGEKLQHGALVDWFTPDFRTEGEAIDEMQQRVSDRKTDKGDSSESATFSDKTFSGLYLWNSEDNLEGRQRSGLLIINDHGQKVTGSSIVETPLKPNKEQFVSHLRKFRIEGDKYNEAGNIKLKFRVIDPENSKILTETVAELKDDLLHGKSVSRIDNKEKVTEISYNWKAKRLEN